MRARPQPFRLLRWIALAAIVAAFGCSDNDTAIFYYIENEQPVVDYSLENQSTILGMCTDGTRYFVSLGGSVWQRATAETTWYEVSPPAGGDWCNSLVSFGGSLYASMLVGSKWGLWRGTAAAQPTWTLVSDADIAERQITALYVAGGRLFASVTDSATSYTLLSSADGSDDSFDATGISGRTKPVTQVTHDGTLYYAAVGGQLLRGAAAAMTTDVTPAAAAGDAVTGVYYSAVHGKVYVATDNGTLIAGDGSTWTEAVTDVDDSSGVTVRFTRIGEAAGGGGNIVFGSMEHGVHYAPTGVISDAPSPTYTRLDDSTDSELYSGTVRDFFVDGTVTFALTAGSGLWRAVYTTAFSEWVRE